MDNPYLGANLRRLRHSRSLSQTALAKSAGLPQPYVSMFERGCKVASPSHLTALARALGVSRGVLISAPIELAVRVRPDSSELRVLVE